MAASENITVVSSNPSGVVNSTPASGFRKCPGDNLLTSSRSDSEALPPPQPGEYVKSKQTISIQVAGHSYQVRVNCIDAEYNAVTITDQTAIRALRVSRRFHFKVDYAHVYASK